MTRKWVQKLLLNAIFTGLIIWISYISLIWNTSFSIFISMKFHQASGHFRLLCYSTGAETKYFLLLALPTFSTERNDSEPLGSSASGSTSLSQGRFSVEAWNGCLLTWTEWLCSKALYSSPGPWSLAAAHHDTRLLLQPSQTLKHHQGRAPGWNSLNLTFFLPEVSQQKNSTSSKPNFVFSKFLQPKPLPISTGQN